MSKQDHIQEFQDEIYRKVDYFRYEFNVSYAEIIGVLEVIKTSLVNELLDEEDEDELEM